MKRNTPTHADITMAALLLKHYQEGDVDALTSALVYSLRQGFNLPDWVVSGVLDAVKQIDTGVAKSWDEVLGSAKKRYKKQRKLTLAVKALEVETLNPDQPIDDSLFERVGAANHTSKSTVARAYYHYKPKDNGRSRRKTSQKRK